MKKITPNTILKQGKEKLTINKSTTEPNEATETMDDKYGQQQQ
jgi:imidazole glycerol phosphate synthase subunit HisF